MGTLTMSNKQESTYLALCTGERVVSITDKNVLIGCGIAEKCRRYVTEEEPWHDNRKVMCHGDVDNFLPVID